MQSDKFDLTAESNRAVLTLGTDASIDLNLGIDVATSLSPWDDEVDAGVAVVATGNTGLENVADLDVELRWKNENFQDLYGADAHFDYDADERFATGIPTDGFALNTRVDQKFVEIFDGYVEFDLYNVRLEIRSWWRN